MLESDIEKRAVERAKRRGWIAIKIGGFGINKRGWPDRLFVWKAIYVWIEFKAAGGELTENQKRRHKELRAQNVSVFTCWTADEAMNILDSFMFPGRNWFPGCEDL